jgi:hypothetical protein
LRRAAGKFTDVGAFRIEAGPFRVRAAAGMLAPEYVFGYEPRPAAARVVIVSMEAA